MSTWRWMYVGASLVSMKGCGNGGHLWAINVSAANTVLVSTVNLLIEPNRNRSRKITYEVGYYFVISYVECRNNLCYL